MRVGCQYERVCYSGGYNFMWNDPFIAVSQAHLLNIIGHPPLSCDQGGKNCFCL